MNLGTIGWMAKQFGTRSVFVWVVCLISVVTAIAYAINRPLIPPGVTPSPHTHAFDIYTNPIHHLDSSSASFARQKLSEKFGIVEQVGLSILTLFFISGLVLRVCRIDEATLAKPTKANPGAPDTASQTVDLALDRIIGPNVVGATLILGLVAVSVVMCYAFYPSREECLKEITFIRADALSGVTSGDYEHAQFWIPRWDEWSRRMEVGVYLRQGKITPYQRMQGFLLRQKLDLLEHELEHEHKDPDALKALVTELMDTNSRWITAYRDPFQPDKRN
jgi:hypothetical protein